MALDGTNIDKVKPDPLVLDNAMRVPEIQPFTALEQTVRANLSQYDTDHGKPVAKVNHSVIRAIAEHIESNMTLVEGSQMLSDNPDMIAELRDHFTACEVLNNNGGKQVATHLVQNNHDPNSLSPLMCAKYDAAISVVQDGKEGDKKAYKQALSQNEKVVLDAVKKEMMAAVSDAPESANYKTVNMTIDNHSAKKLAEAMDKIDNDVLETLKSDPDTYYQAIVDIHHITMMHGKPYGFSSKAKAIAAKVDQHVKAVEQIELENYVQELYVEDQSRLDALRERLGQAAEKHPDLADGIKTDDASLFEIQTLIDGSDWSQFEKMKADKTGYHQTLLEIAKISQSNDKDKQNQVNAIIDHRVENSIDRGIGRKISDGVKSAAVAFAAVAGTALSLKPKMALAKPVLPKIGTSLVSKKGIAAIFGAAMALGASTNAVDQESGVASISFADIEHEVSTVFTGDDVTTPAKPRLVEATTVLSKVAADPSSVKPVDAVKEIALVADALDDQVLGKSSVGFGMVQDGVVEETEIVAEPRPELAYKIKEAATQAYFDTGLVPASNSDMAYLAFGTVEHLAFDGLGRTDAVAIERGEKLVEADIPLSGPAQEIVTLVEETNAQGFTPLMVDSNQMLTQFSKNNPEIMAQIDSAETERTRGEMIMMAAYDIAEANGINMNQLTTGGVLMIPKQFDFDREYPLRKIQSHNRTAGMPQYN